MSALLKLTVTYSSTVTNGRQKGGFQRDTFPCVFSVCYMDNGCLGVTGCQSPVVHSFLPVR